MTLDTRYRDPEHIDWKAVAYQADKVRSLASSEHIGMASWLIAFSGAYERLRQMVEHGEEDDGQS